MMFGALVLYPRPFDEPFVVPAFRPAEWTQGAVCALGILLAGCVGGRTAPQPPATSADPNREEVKHLFAALTVDAPDVERRFSQQLRAVLPPPMLRAGWHSMSARYGSL